MAQVPHRAYGHAQMVRARCNTTVSKPFYLGSTWRRRQRRQRTATSAADSGPGRDASCSPVLDPARGSYLHRAYTWQAKAVSVLNYRCHCHSR